LEFINQTNFQIAPLTGRIGYQKHSLTLIVKGTFDLSNEKDTVVSEEQLYPAGDELYEDDGEGTGSSRYESDFAYFKPRADLLLAGKCYAPGGRPTLAGRVTFQVGDKSKSLAVIGNRYWKGLMKTISDPERFTEMELRYENSFGGEGYKKNPVGKGYRKEQTESGSMVRPLPNIEDMQQRISSISDKPEPAGFGPLGRMWQHRFSKMGTYKGLWLKERWSWFPKDFDWGHFNAAPPDMQVDGYLKGDEELYFENLHPIHSKYQSQLPGLRIRCFINELDEKNPEAKGKKNFKEVKMNLDTLWVDMEAEKLVLVWRGASEIKDEDYEEIKHILIVSEKLEDQPELIDHYQTLLEKELAEEEEEEIIEPVPIEEEDEEDIEMEAEIAKAETQMRASLIEAGIDPDNPPEPSEEDKKREAEILKEMGIEEETEEIPITREIVQQRASKGESFAGEDLSSLDLSGLEMQGIDFRNTILSGVNFKKTNLSGTDFTAANLEKAELNGADMKKAKLNEADFSDANLTGADLSEAELADAIFEKANLENAIFDKVDATDANFTQANLTNASLKWGQFQGAYFSKAILDNANFSGSNLQDVSMEEASGFHVNMTAADLTQLRASDGCDFTQGIFRETIGRESIWEKATLRGADFSFSKMEGADFSSSILEKANFSAADMKFARFTKANLQQAKFISMNLFQGSLEKTNLEEADFSGSNLYGVEFLEAKIVRTKFEQANLKMTKLAK